MEKSEFGISLKIIALVAFAFGVLRQPQALLLVVGFALIGENNEWLNRQVIQALLLTMAYYLSVLISDLIFGGISKVFAFAEIYKISGLIAEVNGFIGGALYIILLIFSLLAILNLLKEKDAGLPYFSNSVKRNFAGNLPPRTEPEAQAEPERPEIPVIEANLCSACSAPLEENASFCTKCGEKV